MREQKEYAPAFWVRERTNKFKEVELRVGVGAEFLEWARQHADLKGYTNVIVRKKRDTSDPAKPTHYAVLDTWKPGDTSGRRAPGGSPRRFDDDAPF
ncbi:MAG: hypothetical protein VW405_07350 [Rhodospirillaceae bacterium]